MPQVNTHSSPSRFVSLLPGDEERDNDTFADELMLASPAKWYPWHPHPQTTSDIPLPTQASRFPPGILIDILKRMSSPRDIHSALLVSRSWCECSVQLLWYRPSVPDINTLVKIIQVLSHEEPTFAYAQFIRRLNFTSVGADMSDSIFSQLARCTRLERLTLVRCSKLSDDVIARTVPYFPNLCAIDLSGIEGISGRTVFVLANSCRKLQGVNLLDCRWITSSSLCALADGCPFLRRVKLSGLVDLTDEPVSALAMKSPLLVEIDLNGCRNISDRAVRDIWFHSYNMRELRLSHCVELTNLAFPAPQNLRNSPPVSNSLPQSANSTRPSASDLLPLILSRPLEHLRMLDLTGCSNITDDAIEGIITASPRLRDLGLSKCSQLTDRAVESICLLEKHLHHLRLSHAYFITDQSIKRLSQCCTRLRYLDLESECF